MGFPISYTNLFLPKFILHILTLLTLIHNLISSILRFTALQFHPPSDHQLVHSQSFSAVLLRELLPDVKFSDLEDPPEICVVCLYEFGAGDEIRGLTNCKHVFHRCCIDRWMDHDRKTCPICRTPVVAEDLRDSFNERLWVASGIADYYGGTS
ncbi:hypothetical protein L1987_73539 [Smallanthus sonchifolius]|uniref:Uncharacterized protein n=1 Tax=Smallanthus sonchifolius TaxID=185202 RepID=A0ACB9A1G3_9ASTR|nr:hypothetical protein L1987_73539 [Smallanthus sonchifolius]